MNAHETHKTHETSTIIYKEEGYLLNGAFFEVYKEKGCGFLEEVYQECLAIEFGLRKIPFNSQRQLHMEYKGVPLQRIYIPDFICFEKIIVEIKAVKELTDPHRSQLQNYLAATNFKLGILVNFGHYPKVQIERFAN